MIINGLMLSNIKDLANFPYMDRYVYTKHHMDTISIYEPVLRRWEISRSETNMMPDDVDTDKYGAYNWTMIQLQFSENPFADKSGMGGAGSALNEWFPADYNDRMGLPSQGEFKRSASWPGCSDVRLNTMALLPLRPTESFVGDGLTLEDGPFLRWIQFIRYPEGVDPEECDDWYVNVHAKEVSKMPGLKRFISYKKLPKTPGVFYRVSELWFADADSWKNAVIDNPPAFTAPAWKNNDEYPFLEPFTHFVSSFVLERPTIDCLNRKGAYIYNA